MSASIDRIVRTIPVSFFQGVLEQFDAAFMKAARLTEQSIAEPERRNMLGQLRHAYAEEGFRIAAQDAGLAPLPCHTKPPGGRYSLVNSEGVCLIRCNIQTHCGPPRATRFRKEKSALNAWLSPVQLDLLIKVEEPPADGLCGMLVSTAYGRGGDPSVPAFVGLGIPRTDMSDWVQLESLTALIGRYHDLETAARSLMEAPVEVKDNAVPKLKRRASTTSPLEGDA